MTLLHSLDASTRRTLNGLKDRAKLTHPSVEENRIFQPNKRFPSSHLNFHAIFIRRKLDAAAWLDASRPIRPAFLSSCVESTHSVQSTQPAYWAQRHFQHITHIRSRSRPRRGKHYKTNISRLGKSRMGRFGQLSTTLAYET